MSRKALNRVSGFSITVIALMSGNNVKVAALTCERWAHHNRRFSTLLKQTHNSTKSATDSKNTYNYRPFSQLVNWLMHVLEIITFLKISCAAGVLCWLILHFTMLRSIGLACLHSRPRCGHSAVLSKPKCVVSRRSYNPLLTCSRSTM